MMMTYDDMAILDHTIGGLQESTDLLAHYSSYAGLKSYAKKTQCMAISVLTSGPRDDCVEPKVEGEPVEKISDLLSSLSPSSLRTRATKSSVAVGTRALGRSVILCIWGQTSVGTELLTAILM